MTTNASGLAFRITNIPNEITGDQLLQLLNGLRLDISSGGELDKQNVLGWSLAPAAASADAARYSTATVTFKSLPTEFQFAGLSKSIYLVPSAPPVNVDRHFYGFTPLAAPSQPLIDIIAVTGLAGHAFGSWKARGGCAMWLRDFLPDHVPGARILSYGYDSTLLGNNSTASIREFSCNLLGDLNTVRANDNEKHRPIIFIGHSLGGLVIKQALTDAAQSYDQNSSIFLSCYAIFLFGVPNLGLHVVSLRSLVKDQPNSSLIADLDASSAFLRRHNFFWEFQRAEGTRVISVYETQPTSTVQETAGVWKQTGPKVMMVSRASAVSATPQGHGDDILSIDANHSDIVKFKTNTSQSYLNVRTRIMSLVDEAPAVISKRLGHLMDSPGSQDLASPVGRDSLNMRSMFTQFRGELEEKKESAIKQWLSPVEFIKHHRHALQGIVQGTGQWLVRTAQYSGWQSSTVSSILWLHGMPGAGKTKLTSMVVESLSPPRSSDGCYHTHEPVVFFYCNRDEPQRRDPTSIMQSLLKQLALVLPGLPKPVVAKYDQRNHGAGSLEFTESTELFISLLYMFPHTTIIVDGLDECDPMGRGRLLETLTTIVHSAPATSVVKLFISSRDDIDIKLRLNKVSNRYIEARDNTVDIERFINRELHQPSSRLSKLSDTVKTKVLNALLAGAGGMFQWVNLQIMNLNGMKLEEDIVENLGKLPKSLTGAYTQILDSMREGTPREWELTRKALMWIMCSRTLLTEEKWTEFAYWPKSIPENGSDILYDICRNLVTLDTQSKVVRFVHLSVHEYLESIFDTVDTNSMAAVCCLAVLSLSLDPTLARSYVTDLTAYSTHRWVDHVMGSQCRDQPMSRLVVDGLNRFMRKIAGHGPANDEWVQSRRQAFLQSFFEPNMFTAVTLVLFADHPQLRGRVHAYIKSSNQLGETLLHLACISGDQLAIQILLENGADIDRLDTALQSPLMTAILHDHEKVVFQLLDKGATIHYHSSILVAVAADGSSKMLLEVMDRDHRLTITEEVLIAAVNNHKDPEVLLKLLLLHDRDIKITEAVIIAAVVTATSWGCSLAAIEALLLKDPTIKFTATILIAAVNNPQMATADLLSKDCDFEITDSVFMAVAQHKHHTTDDDRWCPGITTTCTGYTLFLKLFAKQPKFQITDALRIAVARNSFSCRCLMLLMTPTTRVTDISITNMISSLTSAEMSVMERGTFQTFRILLADRTITEAFLIAAASNTKGGDMIMRLLLDIDPYASITDTVMISALRHSGEVDTSYVLGISHGLGPGEAVMQVLVRARNINITGLVLMEEINKSEATQAMKWLLVNDRGFFLLTEEMLLKLVGNRAGGKRTMGRLRGHSVKANITEAVLVQGVSDRNDAVWILRIFLSWGLKITITEAVVRSAAQNNESGWEAIKFLLSHRKNISITEGAIATIVLCDKWGFDALQEVLDRDDDAHVHENIVKAAVRNPLCCSRMLGLLEGHGLLTDITKAAVAAAAGPSIAGLRSIIEMRPTTSELYDGYITEEVLITAARNPECGDRMMYQLLLEMPNMEVSGSIVNAVADNRQCGKQVMSMLLSRKGSDKITEDAMMAVVGNEEWGTAWVEVLLDSQPSTETIGMIMKAVAASTRRRGVSVIWMLFARYVGPRRLFRDIAVILQASELDFDAIVEESHPHRGRRTGRE